MVGGGGDARGLILLQLTEAAVDGALDAAFVVGQFGERVGTLAIHLEGAGQEVALVGWSGRWRHRFAVFFGVSYLGGVLVLAELVDVGDALEVVAVDAGFHGEGAVEAPLIGGDAQDQGFFAGADGAEAVEEVLEEEEEVLGILAGEDVFVGAQAVAETVAAGCGFAFRGARAGGFLGVLAVGVDLGLGGFAGTIRFFRVPYLAFMLRGRIWGTRTLFSQIVENRVKSVWLGL